MEREFKWDAFGALQDAVLMWALNRDADSAKMTEMDARYFDTADGALSAEKTALRLRRENEDCICCLKLRGGEVTENGLHAHAEYECKATCIAEGLAVLPERGAPIELCNRLRTMKLTETCRIAFSRYTVMLRQDGASAELAFDRGRMTVNGRSMPLCEIELEYKDGPGEAFLAMGQTLMQEFRLRPQPLSKLARARALAERPEKPPVPPHPPVVEEMIELPDMPEVPEPPMQYIPSGVSEPPEVSERSEAPEPPKAPEASELSETSGPTEVPEVSEPPETAEMPEVSEVPEPLETQEKPEPPETSEQPEVLKEAEPFEEFALQELTEMLNPAKEPVPLEAPELPAPEQLELFDVIDLPDLSELCRSLDMPSDAPDSEPPTDLPKLLDMLKILEKKSKTPSNGA